MNRASEVLIPRTDWDLLKKRDAWLDCLEAAGVDNWDGISFAYEIQQEREGDDG